MNIILKNHHGPHITKMESRQPRFQREVFPGTVYMAPGRRKQQQVSFPLGAAQAGLGGSKMIYAHMIGRKHLSLKPVKLRFSIK